MTWLAPFWRARVLPFLRRDGLTGLVIVGLVVAYLALRTSPAEVASAEAFAAGLRQGVPTVVEFYSNT